MYRSSRFLPLIKANLDVLADIPGVEVLISDRHGLDHAQDQLRQQYGADPRFRFFAATDGIDWVAHYNWLLDQGRGQYFAWMPHDDTFPAGYYTGLADYLDDCPDALLAFGPLRGHDEAGHVLPWATKFLEPPPWHTPSHWEQVDAYRMLRTHPWVPFRGVFRRAPIVQAGLTIHPTLYNTSADVGWVFGVGLLGPVRFVDVPPCTKRFYPDSTHRRAMPHTVRSVTSYYRKLYAYAARYSLSRLTFAAGLTRLAWQYTAHLLVKQGVKSSFIGLVLRRIKRRLAS